MSLSSNVADLATRIATEVKAIRTLVNGNAADLSSLNTTAKTNLVAAINELQASIAGASGIDDGVTSTTTSWSSSKTDAEIDAAIAALVNAAPGTLDTLNELAAALGDDPNFATTVTNQIAGKADASHTHAGADVAAATESARGTVELATTTEATTGTDTTRAVTPAGVKAVADTKAAATHTHAIADTTGLQTALDGKAASSHTHTIANVTGLQTALDAKAASTDVGSTTTNFVTIFETGLA